MINKPLRDSLLLLASIILVGVVGFMVVENWNIGDSFYMTIITLTTTGFQEVHHLEQALKAHAIFKKDIDYVVNQYRQRGDCIKYGIISCLSPFLAQISSNLFLNVVKSSNLGFLIIAST